MITVPQTRLVPAWCPPNARRGCARWHRLPASHPPQGPGVVDEIVEAVLPTDARDGILHRAGITHVQLHGDGLALRAEKTTTAG